jgi:AraC-like DNA-binding protein
LLARQRQRAADQRAATRVAELGFASVRAYLVDRLVTQAWTLEEVVGELGAAPATLRRLLDRYQVQRVAPTRRQRAAAAAASGPQKELRVVQQRRQARLTKLGFATLEAYLQDRYVGAGWSVRRLSAELGVGHGWVDEQLSRLGLRA